MKILLVHNYYQSTFVGGEDIVFQRELLALKKQLGNDNVFEYSVCNNDINIFKLVFTIWFSKKHYKKIYKIVDENRIDLVHVHNFYPLLTLSIFKAAKKAGAKTVYTIHSYRWWCISGIFYRRNHGICELCAKKKFPYHGIFYRCYRNSFLQSIMTASAFFFYKITNQIRYIDKFFVLTAFGMKKVVDLGLDKNKVILKPNFVKFSDIKNDDKKDFIYVGKLDESKGVLELLKTWKELDKKYVLKLIGLGELDKELSEFKSDNIIFLGKLNNDQTMQEIAKSKYLIAPSIMYETFGLTIIEAMSLGVPVIGFKIGTRPDFIQDNKNGFLTDVNNLKITIEKANNFDNYLELSAYTKIFANNFSEEKIIKDQIIIYQQIITNNL